MLTDVEKQYSEGVPTIYQVVKSNRSKSKSNRYGPAEADTAAAAAAIEMTGLAASRSSPGPQPPDEPAQQERTSLLADAPRNPQGASRTYRNFLVFSVLFSAVPSAALACLALATARLGTIGAWQSGVLYLTYTLTAVVASPWIVQQLGSRNAVVLGQALFGSYVACFWLALVIPHSAQGVALTGAGLGGVGSAILWTAQGVYFTQTAEVYSLESGTEWSDSTSLFSGIFAFCLLAEETLLDLASTIIVRTWNVPWTFVFAIYALIAVLATLGTMNFVKSYPRDDDSEATQHTCLGKASAAVNLLIRDSKMKYFVFFNSSFAFAGAFLNSFVSGEVVPVALKDARSSYVGMFVAIHGGSAALFSLVFGKWSQWCGKGPILAMGSLAFAGVAIPFLVQPDLELWTWKVLLLVYMMEGIGRATFEGALKAVFADFFPYQKEASFANIILQNGLTSVLAYVLSVRLLCPASSSSYCVEYRDGTYHQVGIFCSLLVGMSLLAILGYLRASYLQAAGVDTFFLSEYRRKSIDTYRRSSMMTTMERRTYESLRAAVAEEEEREAHFNALPKVT